MSYNSTRLGTITSDGSISQTLGSITTGLIAYWKLDEQSGTRNDSRGTNHLADNNTVLYDVGKDGNAASFVRANSEYLQSAAALALCQDGVSGCTVSAWVRPDASENFPLIFGSATTPGGSTTRGIAMIVGTTTYYLRVGIFGSGETDIPISLTFSNGTWVHIVGGFDASTKKSFALKNGEAPTYSAVLADSKFIVPIGTDKILIGGGWTNGGITGLIDEVAVWNRVLTSQEISDLYRAGAGKFYPFA